MGLGALVQAAAASSSIKEILKSTFTRVEHAAQLTVDSWMRASKFPEICPREEVLVSIGKVPRQREITVDDAVTLETGKALHHLLQNSMLPEAGILLGEWSCRRCGKHFGVKRSSLRIDQYAVKRPSICDRCENDVFEFHEYTFYNTEFRIEGHMDGILSLPGMNGLGILEGKSIAPKGGWEVRSVPKLDHVVQSHIYMWFTGLQWSKILYWDKGTYGLGAFVEHTVERCEDTITEVKKTLRSLWDGLRTGLPPTQRICANPEAPRACKCPVVVPCFTTEATSAEDV